MLRALRLLFFAVTIRADCCFTLDLMLRRQMLRYARCHATLPATYAADVAILFSCYVYFLCRRHDTFMLDMLLMRHATRYYFDFTPSRHCYVRYGALFYFYAYLSSFRLILLTLLRLPCFCQLRHAALFDAIRVLLMLRALIDAYVIYRWRAADVSPCRALLFAAAAASLDILLYDATPL